MATLIDNQKATMAEHLRRLLSDAEMFRLVTAYFSIYGFEALADRLESDALHTRFLFGDPESVDSITTTDKPKRAFTLTEQGLSITLDGNKGGNVLQQRQLAERCTRWVKRNSVEIRSLLQANFLHGKMYHLSGNGKKSVTVGSSNFTRRGLGLSQTPNLEINIASVEKELCADTETWFDELWGDKKLTEDVKPQVIAALERIFQENPPELIYYKTLYELFREEIETRGDSEQQLADAHLYDTKVWEKLYEFQKDGAKSVIARLLRHNGCILADSVGLGKTFTALAVIKFFEMRNERVLVLCPKKLKENWRAYQASSARADNPLEDDRLSYHLLSHTDLGRNKGMSDNINLANFNWENYDLVVIDESHNFRNAPPNRYDDEGNIIRQSRYAALIENVIKKGITTKVLMLSATPVNTSLTDIRNQIYLMTGERDDTFIESLGINNIKTLIDAAQKQFKEWESKRGEKKKEELLEKLGGDFLHLLSGVTIARSRRQIQKFYKEFIEREGDFPDRKLDTKYPPTDNIGKLSFEMLNKQIGKLNFHIYRPSDYVTDDSVKKRLAAEKEKYKFNQQTRERFLIDMMRVNFFKRLESSAYALNLTLERTIKKIDDMIAKIDAYKAWTDTGESERLDDKVESTPEDDEDDEDFLVNRRVLTPYHLRELDTERWRADMLQDRNMLQAALDDVKKITPERDGKLDALKKKLQEKSVQKNRKLLIFTTFKDTAVYLYEQIESHARKLNMNIAMIAGDTVETTFGRREFNDVLSNFSPASRQRDSEEEEIDVLIATDCISEGQNLQDCDTVLNYDIHWNPVRLIQRFGRIDRIGSRNKTVHMVNYWPTEDMDLYLNLQARVKARMALADATATGDDDFLNDEETFNEAVVKQEKIRDREVKRMQKEIFDLDELPDSISMSDLTLDYFLTQLLRYMRQNKEKLESVPPGAHAVADCADAHSLFTTTPQPGAIFFFRQHNAPQSRVQNPTHPFYFVHMQKDGLRHGYMQAHRILNLFEALAGNKAGPITTLCDKFNRSMNTPEGKAYYDKMARAALTHIKVAFNKNEPKGLKNRNTLLTKISEKPTELNLELVTWLVIGDDNETDGCNGK